MAFCAHNPAHNMPYWLNSKRSYENCTCTKCQIALGTELQPSPSVTHTPALRMRL